MAKKKPRPQPVEQGSLAAIYKMFLAPFIFFKPEMWELSRWQEHLFDFHHRDITRYVARRPFKLPGLFYAAARVKIQGIGYRQVKVGDELWVRQDARDPGNVDVEWLGGVGQKDQMFQLTSSEWNSIAANLKESEREERK